MQLISHFLQNVEFYSPMKLFDKFTLNSLGKLSSCFHQALSFELIPCRLSISFVEAMLFEKEMFYISKMLSQPILQKSEIDFFTQLLITISNETQRLIMYFQSEDLSMNRIFGLSCRERIILVLISFHYSKFFLVNLFDTVIYPIFSHENFISRKTSFPYIVCVSSFFSHQTHQTQALVFTTQRRRKTKTNKRGRISCAAELFKFFSFCRLFISRF